MNKAINLLKVLSIFALCFVGSSHTQQPQQPKSLIDITVQEIWKRGQSVQNLPEDIKEKVSAEGTRDFQEKKAQALQEFVTGKINADEYTVRAKQLYGEYIQKLTKMLYGE